MRHLSWVGLPMLFASAAGAQEDFTIACDSLEAVSVLKGSALVEVREVDGRTAIAMADQNLGSAVLGFEPLAPVTPGQAYLLAVDLRGAGLSSCQVRPEVRFLDAAGDEIAATEGDWVIHSAPWRRLRVVAVAPEGASQARIVIHGVTASMVPLAEDHKTGAVLIDDIEWMPAPRLEHESSAAGNVVEEGDPIEFTFRAEGAPAGHEWVWHASVVDWLGGVRTEADGMSLDVGPTWSLSFEGYGRGYYEARWWIERDGQLCLEGRVPFSVVPPLAEQPFDPDSQVALDAGFAWFVADTPERLRLAARLARMAGLTCLRDRLSWARTNPAEGVYTWGEYAETARAQREAGITVYQVMHDCPEWAREAGRDPVSAHAAPPRDLRAVYRYFREAASAFPEEIPYWEIWNEPDIFFFAGRPEEYAGILKAAYLGCHHGNPNSRVLLGSLAHPPGQWYQRALECGLSDYMDIWNMHYYGSPEGVIDRIRANQAAMLASRPEKPVWLTEMGVPAHRAADGSYVESEREQASYLVKAYSNSLGHGVDRFFYFFMQEFLEAASSLWGITRVDLTPKPAYSALAQYAALVGGRHCLGRLDWGDPSVYAYAWGPLDDAVVVAWAGGEAPLPDLTYSQALDLMGQPLSEPTLGPTPLYLVGVEGAEAEFAVDAGPVLEAPAPENLGDLAVVVDLRLLPEEDAAIGTPDRKAEPRLGPNERLPLRAGLYNFGEETVAVEPELLLPAGWSFEGALPTSVEVAPGELSEYLLTVVPGPMRPLDDYALRLQASVGGRELAPAVAYVGCDREALEPAAWSPLGPAADDPHEWHATHSENTRFSVELAGDDGLRNRADMPGEGDRWVMANCPVLPDDDLASQDAVSVEFRSAMTAAESLIVILVESDGSQYMASADNAFRDGDWVRHRFWLRDLALNRGVSADENESLDLDQVERILFGASFRTGISEAEWWIRDARLERF